MQSGVLSRQTSICPSGIPIKKRRFPFIPLASPPREEAPAPFSEMNDTDNKRGCTGTDLPVVENTSKDSINMSGTDLPVVVNTSKDSIKKPDMIAAAPSSGINDTENQPECTGIDLPVVANTLNDSTQKSGMIKNSLSEVKKEIASDVNATSIRTDICTEPISLSCCSKQLDVKKEVPSVLRVNSVQSNAESGKSQDEQISPTVISADKVNNNFSSLVNETSAGHDVLNSNMRFPTVNVKKEMVDIRQEGDYRHELSTALGNTESSLTLSELVKSPLGNQKVDLSSKVTDKLDPPLLSLSLRKAELPDTMGVGINVTDSNVIMSSTDRSKWDLNTTMDAWEGSIEDAASHETMSADKLNSSDDTHDVKHFLSSTCLLNVKVDKGKRVMEPFEERSTPCISSMSFQQFSADDSLCLRLSTSSPHDSACVMPSLSLQSPIINSILSGSRPVKSEPADGSLKPGLLSIPGGTMESLDTRLVDKKYAESCEASKTLAGNFRKLTEPTPFKSEVSKENNQETQGTANFILKRASGDKAQHQESCSSSSTVVSGSITRQQPFVPKLTTCSELTGFVGVLDQSEHYRNTTGINIKDIMNPSITSQMSEPVDNYCKDPNVCDNGKVNCETMIFSLQSDKNNIEQNTITEESTSDKEKISAMLEGDCYVSDYESDGNHAVVSQMGRDGGQCELVDDDYEDGEVRELPEKSLVEDPTRVGVLLENIKEVDGIEMGVPTYQSTIIKTHGDIEPHDGGNGHNERIEAMTKGNSNQLVSDYISLPVTKSEQVASVQTEAKVQEKSLVNLSVQDKGPGVKEDKLMDVGESTVKDMGLATAIVARNENDRGSNETLMNFNGRPNSSLSKVEVTGNGHGSFKDSALGGNRSRIINLPRAPNSPSRIRSLSGRSFTSWSGRERYGDVDSDNLYYRGHRDDTCGDDSRKFTRDRSFRNSRMDFKHDNRGRSTGQLDSLHNKWDLEHDFPSKNFNVSADYRFNKHRRGSAVADNGLRSNDFVVAPDGTGTNAGRVGRNPLIDEFHSFRQPSSRRLSPGSRDGATIRSVPNLRRIPESGSDIPGPRHEKFSGSAYTRPQTSYDEMGGQFVHRNQDYSTVQRRVFPHSRSKSPGSTRSRSPGTWPSSRRRFNDDFGNPSDQIQHRPLMYRMERIRSPDRVCYTDELGDRRRVSPNYVTRRANEMRDMDLARENGHLRPLSSNGRSPSDRAFPRSTRRDDVVDSRERTDSDEYFSGPIHSGRFNEFRSDGSNDERRKFGERRGLFRPSRPSYGGGNENYRFNAEDGPRPPRFCSDQGTENFERNNVRQRDFDGGTKTRPLIAQRQIRSTEDQEGSFGQTGDVWHDESFSDGSKMKRRRF